MKHAPTLPLLVLMAMGAGCWTAPPSGVEGGADASGVVREVLDATGGGETLVRILVEHPGAAAPADRSLVHVSAETTIRVRGPDGRLHAGEVGDLRVGALVEVETTGVELRSYPRQVFATRIEVTRRSPR